MVRRPTASSEPRPAARGPAAAAGGDGPAPAPPEAYRYELPPELIAQEPGPRRAGSRLLLLERDGGVLGERRVRDLPDLLRRGDLLVVNDSRVLPARLRARRQSGGRVELLLTTPRRPDRWEALARPARRLRAGERLRLVGPQGEPLPAAPLRVAEVLPGGYVLLDGEGVALAALARRWGSMPLPPYIRRRPDDPRRQELRRRDRRRYQTVYARREGSVAAPTAGLHFDAALLRRLRAAGIGTVRVTLHVGPGTFRPPDAGQVAGGRLHAERFRLPAATAAAVARTRAAGGRVVAVGTTTLRVLETVARLPLAGADGERVDLSLGGGDGPPLFEGRARRRGDAWEVAGLTRLFIRPPERPGAADALLTNFHLPGSSLLMLLAAFAGEAAWRGAYARAVADRFRFYSYGDAMLVLPPDRPPRGAP